MKANRRTQGPVVSLILSPLSILYGAVIRLRLLLYALRIFRSEAVSAPVISVGNITVGGTGKTPVVEWIARRLAGNGLKVCVLTRGYGRTNPRQRVVASDGETQNISVRETGDEAMLLSKNLAAKAAVVCDANRVNSAQWAINNLGSEVFVLDDGFQHLKISRDLNIVLIDAMDPFGNGRLLPFGRLREPLSGLARSDAVLITRSDQVENIEPLRSMITEYCGKTPIFAARTVVRRIVDLHGKEADLQHENTRALGILAFCGIGNPLSFFTQLRDDGWKIADKKIFRDHHVYSQSDVDELVTHARRVGVNRLITTAKDSTKLGGLKVELDCLVVDIDCEIDQDETLAELIFAAVNAKRRPSGEN